MQAGTQQVDDGDPQDLLALKLLHPSILLTSIVVGLE